LGIRDDLAIAGIDTRIILVISKARFENTFLGIVGGIVGTTNAVIYVFTKVRSVGTGGVACFKAELAATHEVVPFDDLLVRVVILTPSSRINKTTQRVSSHVSAMRIQFSSSIVRYQIDESLVNEPNDLDVIGSSHKLNALEGTRGNGARPPARLGAPCYFLAFGVGDERIWCGRSPKAEIIKRIQERRLAERRRALSRRIAKIVSILRATKEIIGVGLVRNASRVCEVFAGEGGSRERLGWIIYSLSGN
jgi:hypothetical protein